MDTNAVLYQDLEKILVKREDIAKAVRELGKKLTEQFRGESPVFICILKGASVFFTDLIREIDLPLTTDFMVVSSYGSSTKTTGVVKIVKDLDEPLKDRHVLVVEDIVDSGRTLSYLIKMLEDREPASIKLCTLLDKPERRVTDVKVDYTGFEIPDEFVVGYGLDYDQRYRNLPYIGVVEFN